MLRRFLFVLTVLFVSFQGVSLSEETSIRDRLDFAAGLYSRSFYDMAVAEYQELIDSYPNHSEIQDAYFGVAEAHFFAEDYEKAMEAYHAFAQKFGNDSRVEFAKQRFSEALYRSGKTQEAKKSFEGLLKSPSAETQVAAQYFLGKLNFEQQAISEAKKHFLGVYQNPEAKKYLMFSAYYLGEILLIEEKPQDAIPYFELISTGETNELIQSGTLGLGKAHFLLKDYEKALTYFKNAFDLDHANEIGEQALLNQMRVFYNTNETSKLTSIFKAERKKIKNQARVDESLLLVANALSRNQQFTEALPYFEELLSRETLSEAIRKQGVIGHLEALSRTGQAAGVVESIDQLENPNQFGDELYYLKGQSYQSLGKAEDAVASYDMLLNLYPDSEYRDQVMLKKGYLLVETEQNDAAYEVFTRFEESFPQHELVAKVLADKILLSLRIENWQRAIFDSEQFMTKYAEDEAAKQILYRLGSLYTEVRDFEKAHATYGRYVKSYPEDYDQEVFFFMGLNQQLAENYENALELYRKVSKDRVSTEIYLASLKNLGYSAIYLQDYDTAANSYRQILKEDPRYELTEEIYLWLLDHYVEKEDGESIRQILEVFKGAHDLSSYESQINFYQGESFRVEGACDQALPHYDAAISANQLFVAQSYLGKGLCHRDQNNSEQSVLALEQAIRSARDDYETALDSRMQLGKTYMSAEDYFNAAKTYLAVGILYEDDIVPQALFEAGVAFSKAGKAAESQQAFSELRERFPDHELIKMIPAEASGE